MFKVYIKDTKAIKTVENVKKWITFTFLKNTFLSGCITGNLYLS